MPGENIIGGYPSEKQEGNQKALDAATSAELLRISIKVPEIEKLNHHSYQTKKQRRPNHEFEQLKVRKL